MTDIIPRPTETGVIAWNREQRDLIRKMYASENVTPEEFNVFLEVSARTGLNPFNRQIYIISRGRGDSAKATIQVAIDGYRLIAQRSGELTGVKNEWCGADGIWTDVWIRDDPPMAAKCTVMRNHNPFEKVVLYREYVQTKPKWEGQGGRNVIVGQEPTEMWVKMPANQIAKCAEAGALRMAFPAEMSGIFVDDEEAALDRVAREEQRRAQRATLVNPPQRASAQKAPQGQQRPQAAQTRQQPREQPQPPQEEPAVTEDGEIIESAPTEGPMPWGAFWNVLSGRTKTLTKDGVTPTVGDICGALGITGALGGLQAWYMEAGSPGESAAELVVDALQGKGFA